MRYKAQASTKKATNIKSIMTFKYIFTFLIEIEINTYLSTLIKWQWSTVFFSKFNNFLVFNEKTTYFYLFSRLTLGRRYYFVSWRAFESFWRSQRTWPVYGAPPESVTLANCFTIPEATNTAKHYDRRATSINAVVAIETWHNAIGIIFIAALEDDPHRGAGRIVIGIVI